MDAQQSTSTSFLLSQIQDLLDIEDLAEARHVEYILNQRLEVADNQLATLLGNHFVQAQEYAQARAADIVHAFAIHDYHIAQIHLQRGDVVFHFLQVQ